MIHQAEHEDDLALDLDQYEDEEENEGGDADFDALLADALDPSTADDAKPTSPAGDFDDLDALLSDAVALTNRQREARQAAKAIAAARKQLNRGGLAMAEIEAIKASIAQWEEVHIWQNIANVAVFERANCANCGFESYHFQALMVKQQHRTNASARRLTRTTAVDVTLPREIRYTQVTLPLCERCAMDSGWAGITAQPFEGEIK